MVRVLSLARQRTAHPARTYTHHQQHTGYTLTRVAHTLLHAKSGRVPTEAGNTHTRRHTPTTRRHPLSGPLPVASGPQQLRPAARHMPHRATHCGARHMVPAEPAQTRRTGQPACNCPAPPHGPARIDAAGVVHEPRRMQGVCPRPRGMPGTQFARKGSSGSRYSPCKVFRQLGRRPTARRPPVPQRHAVKHTALCVAIRKRPQHTTPPQWGRDRPGSRPVAIATPSARGHRTARSCTNLHRTQRSACHSLPKRSCTTAPRKRQRYRCPARPRPGACRNELDETRRQPPVDNAQIHDMQMHIQRRRECDGIELLSWRVRTHARMRNQTSAITSA